MITYATPLKSAEIHQPTIAEMMEDKIDLQVKLDALLKDFHKKYPQASLSITLRRVIGDYQATLECNL